MTGHLDLNAELEKYADRLGTSTRRMDEQDKTAARLQIIYDAMIKRSKELGDVQNQVAVEFDRATTKIQNQREELQKLAAPYATWWLQFKVGVLGTIKWLNELEPALNLERGLFNKRGKSLKDMSESNVKVLEAEAAAWEAFSGKVSPVMPALKPLKPLSPEEQREFEKVMAGLLEDERERITQTDKLQEDAYKRQFEGAKNLGELVVALRRSTADKLRAIDSKYLEEGAKAEKETFEVMSKFAMIEIDQRESVAKAYGDETDVMEARHAKELQVMKDKYSQTEKWDSTYAKEYLNLIQIQTIEVEKNLAKQFEARVKSNEDYENLLLEQVQYIRGMEEEKLSIQGEDLAAMKLRHRTEVEALQKKYKDFETHDATYTNAHLALIERQGVQIVDLEKQKARTREDFQLETTAKLIELTGTEYDAFKTSQDKQRISWKRMLDDKIISQKNYNDRIAVADKELNEKLLLASDDFFAGLELARAKDAQKRYTWAQAGVDIWNDAIKNMTSATSDFLFYGLQGKWSDALKVFQNFGLAMLRSYTDTLAKMIVETASAEATMAAIRAAYRGIAAWLGFGGGGELGGIGETYGEGGIVKGGFVPIRAFQGGGIVRRPTLGLVGEGGQDEAVIPLQGGKVPVDLRGGQESAPIIININAVDANSFVNLLANNRRVLAQLIASSIGTPGPLRSAVRGT